MKNPGSWLFPLGGAALLFLTSLLVPPGGPGALGTLRAQAPCTPPFANEIVAENCLPGSPANVWDVSGAGDPSIQGFATDISVNQGETVFFKIATDATDYRLEIYRMGYYQGNGARLIATVEPSLTPSPQPACLEDLVTGLVDCGNWDVSASWSVPSDATSGIYFAKLVREQGPAGASHVAFIVRDDDGQSDLLFQTSDTTWQAYNDYGGNSLYVGSPAGRAYKVSYNRPFVTRGGPREDWIFNAEYPMVRWLEQNGYDVSYFTGVDGDRLGAEIQDHRILLSVGHDEYWSGVQRANVEAARNAGVHLAFFSGNEIFWKTRWESSIDGSATSHRTLVTYKETHANAKIDPLANVWTGTWRDPRFSPPADGGRPENALTGTIFTVNGYRSDSIVVPAEYAPLRFWRHTTVANLLPGQNVVFAAGTLGYEWDEDLDNGHRPPGSIRLSSATVNINGQYLQDFGSTYGNGTATHHLTLYKHASGALVFGAGTVHWSWGLDANHEFPGPPADLRMQQATVNLFADMGVSPATPQANLIVDSGSADSAAPTSAIESPVSGATVPSGSPVAMSGTAVDVDGEVGGVEVSVDGGLTWHVATGRNAWSFEWTPGAQGAVTLKSRAVDDSGNLETPSPGVTVNVGPPAPPNCPCTIWSPSTTPGVVDSGDTGAVELGVKLRSDVDGFITGLRFYKASANTGTHTGRVWTSTGTLLGTLTFTGETASGWQESSFAAPVAVSANTTYIASYHLPSGRYSFNGGYFSSSGTDNPPLHALQNGVDGPNGVYHYGAGGIFPTDTFNSANYWVDVVLNTTVGPDTTPPIVTSITPGSGANGIATSTNVTATFNEPIDATTLSGATFELRDPSAAIVASTVTYSAVTRTATLDPATVLSASTTYTATVRGGPTGVKDPAANALAADVTWSFTTAAPPPPPPNEGPGGPILVIADVANPFTRYYAEILRNEGLNAFTVTDISLVTPAVLAVHDVAILGEMLLTAAQVTMLSDWVSGGGNLIAMRPDKQLAGLLGLADAASTLSNAYLLVNTASAPGTGVVGQTMQFHGTADRYTPSGATVIATLYSDATTGTANPAVTLRSVGVNGGQAAAFTFDLARSVVYTRQGNPLWVGQERDGTGPMRANDMFFGAASGDVQPDWIDLNKVAIPQADEQQRLLANLILHANLDRKPLPRFWYFPRGEKAVVIMTGDDHGAGGTVGRFNNYLSSSPTGCSVSDWDCVRSSSYIYAGTPINDGQALSFHNSGFEIGVHVDTGCANWTPASLEGNYASQLAAVAGQLPSIPPPSSNRTHCIAWSDWATQATVEVAHGIRLDTNYYYWPPSWVQDRPGFFTGSGMPMRFADLDGTIIDTYQAVTQMTDESGQSYPFTINTLLDRALGAEAYYGAFTANMHTDGAAHAGSDAIVASALARSVPVVSGRQMLNWLDGRNGSAFGSLAWGGNSLSFTIAVGAGANGLRAMVPTTSAVGALTGITFNGNPIVYSTETIKGVGYAFFPAAGGAYVANYAVDATGPVITGVTATPGGNGTSATVTWTTSEPATSRVDYGTSPGALTLSVSGAALLTEHSLQFTGLTPSTTYYYRATSADALANASTSPAPPDPPASFATPAPQTTFTDTTVSDFGAGTGCAVVAHQGDGEVSLAPTEGSEFPGTALPAGWSSTIWAIVTPGGSVSVADGVLSVDGARAGTTAAYSSGRVLEFSARFTGSQNQHIGFADTLNDSNGWAIFSTGGPCLGSGSLCARTHNGGGELAPTVIPGSFLNAFHRFRIEWNANGVNYSIDGNLVASHSGATLPNPLRPLASDIAQGDGVLSVDWLQMSPYLSPCSFDSRIFDAGGAAAWGTLNWNALTPAGTTLAMSVRQGDTPTPDGSWTSFNAIPASGGAIGGTSRYLQYRADLVTTNPGETPVLLDVNFGFTPGGDSTPPSIVSRTPVPAATGVALDANVVVQFSEPMDGGSITTGTFTLRPMGGSEEVGAVVTYNTATATLDPLSPLSLGRTYEVTVSGSVTDLAGNPLGANDVWTFATTNLATFMDTTTADFGAGAPGACSVVSQAGDGEVILAPTLGSDFSGTMLPPDWASFPWGTGGTSTVAGGLLVVDGARANTEPAAGFGPGRSLEFVATFAAAAFQHVGFGGGNDGEIFTGAAPWAMFSTGSGGSSLLARTFAGAFNDVTIPGSFLGTPHRYRIDWLPDRVDFVVDGALVSSHNVTIAGFMRPAVSDFSVGGATVAVDWIQMSPYASSCSFVSRVFDAGGTATWGSATWTSDTPTNTSVVMRVRQGNTPTPDGSWTSFSVLPSSGSSIGGNSRYLQYRAELATTDSLRTPALLDVTVGFSFNTDTTPPTIVGRSPAPDTTGIAVSSNVTVQFSEPMNGSTLTSSTFRLRAVGASGDVPATVSYAGAIATLDPISSLDLGTIYQVTVSGTVTDVAGNPLGTDETWTFTTIATAAFTDTSVADFSAGTGACSIVAHAGDGEVTLAPTEGSEFSGSSLPTGWSSFLWDTGSGSAIVAGGNLVVDGARASTNAVYGPGRSVEFVAKFTSGAPNQHVGLGVTFNELGWAIFSTGGPCGGAALCARSSSAGAGMVDSAPLAGSWLNAFHRFRIVWNAGTVDFFIDGTPVASQAIAITESLRPLASDFTVGDGSITVDWLQMSPYLSPCAFESRLFDAGAVVTWDSMTWTPDTPLGTTIAMSVRFCSSVDPGDCTAYQSLTSPGPISGVSQFIQYRADLATADPNQTPVLKDVTISYRVNRAPTASPQSVTTAEDTPANITLTGTDVDGDSLTFAVATQPAHGTLSGTAPNLTYTPNANYHGPDSFTFTVSDGSLTSAPGTVSITVTPLNDGPTANPQSVTTAEDTPANITLTGTDVDGDSLTFAVGTPPANGTLSGTAPNVTYTPNGNYHGPDSFTFTVSDGSLTSVAATVSITVTPLNDGPTANPQSVTTAEDTPLNITLTGTDVDGDSLTFAVATQPANGTLSGTAPNVTYTPNANYHGADSFTFTVSDGSLTSVAATVSITVTPLNDGPTANPQSVTTAEDTPLNITLTGTDVDGDSLTFAVATQPANGTLSGTAPNVTYTPNANYHGADSFTFTVSDGSLTSVAATVSITVTPLNDGPTANPQSVTTAEDTPLNITLTGTDVDGDSLTFAVATQPANGTLSGTAPNVTYTPNANYHGPDSFTFTVSDGSLTSVAATVSITVTPLNDGPTANAQSVTTAEDTPLNITLTGTDVDGDGLTFAVATQPANGTLSGTAPNVTYTPNANYHGPDSFTFTVSDGSLTSVAATVSITVTPLNDGPTANPQSVTTAEDTPLNITLTGTDVDGDSLTFAVATQPANGTLSGTAPNVTYTPNANYHGPDSFTFTVSDGSLTSAPATVSITVTPLNDGPTANAQSVTTAEDTPLNITLTGTDVDGDGLTFAVATQPANGTLSGTAPNVTYTPNANCHGPDSFTFTVSDGSLTSAPATVSITVTPLNDGPTANPQSMTTAEDTPLNITLTGTDVDGDSLTFAVATQPANGTLSGTAPNVTYTPNANHHGPDSFTFTVSDGSLTSVAATVSITVTPLNDGPTANPQSVTTAEDTPLNITLTGTDVDGDSLTFAVATQPANGTLSGTAPNVTYTPNANYHGADSFTFTVSDGSLTSVAATVSITVTPLNDGPTANPQSVTTAEDTPLNITLTGTDVDGDSLTFAVATQPANGTLSGTAPNVTYTPNANYHGPDSFTFTVSDASLTSAAATVSITVTPLNDGPTANPQSVTTAEDTPLNITLTGTDVDGDGLTFAVATQPANGTLSGTAPNVTYTPNGNYHGPDSFTFTVSDGSLTSVAATVSITVTPLNDGPTANPQSVTTAEDTPLNITLTGTDVDGDSLTFAVATQPANGTLSGTAPNVTYTPNANYHGADSFTFTVSDGSLTSVAATVSITVTPLNDGPTANPQSVTTAEDTPLNITLTGTDVDGDSLTFAVATQPANGTLSGTAPNVTYTPNANYHGADSFTFTVSDGSLTSVAATVSITVTPLNDGPTANPQSVTTAEDTPLNITLTGTDVDGDSLTFAVATQPANGTLSGTAPNVTYTPNANYHGADSFTFTVSDGSLTSVAATVSITVTPLNDGPTANPQSVTTAEDTPLNITLTGTDVDGDSLTFAVATQPANGTLSGTAPNVTYTPNANYHGPDSFTFTVSDGSLTSVAATVSITVTPLNDGPTANAQSVTTAEDTPLNITLTGTDVDGDGLTFAVATQPANGTLSGTAPNVTYTPNANHHGPDSFTFTVSDGSLTSVAATVSITVTPLNDGPTANPQSVTTAEDTPLNITLTGTDVDGDSLTFAVATQPANGTLSGTAPNVTYTPNANYHGPDSFTFTVSDGSLTSAPATVSITVTPLNDGPTANAQSVTTAEDTPLNITLTGTDVDGDGLTFAVATQPANGTLSGTAPNVTYTPNANYHGPDSFTFTVSDGSLTSAPATVSITVTPLNDGPTANPQSMTTAEDTPLNITLTGTDVDGDSLTFAVATQPANGTLSGTAPNVTYTPNANHHGPDSFTFTVSDGSLTSVAATVSITVTPLNDGPTANAQSMTTAEDTPLNITLTGTDVDGDGLTFAVATQPANGTLSGTAPNVTYTPNANCHGPDSFTFTVSDGSLTSAPATVSITVTPLNDGPTANAQSVTTAEDTPLNITLTGTDVDGDSLTFAVATQPANGTLSGTAPNVTYTPNGNYHGPDSFTFTVSDGSLTSAPGTVSITVTPLNDGPTANPQSMTTAEDTPLNITLTGTDVDGDSLTFAVATQPANGTLSGTAPNVTYTPNGNYHGADSFTFTVSDGSRTSAAATVSIIVTPMNDAPVAANDSYTTTPGRLLTVSAPGVLGNDMDVDGNSLSATRVSGPGQGTLTLNANGSFTYTPVPGFTGIDTFTYRAKDSGNAESNVATVTITVRSPTAHLPNETVFILSKFEDVIRRVNFFTLSTAVVNSEEDDDERGELDALVARDDGAAGVSLIVSDLDANEVVFYPNATGPVEVTGQVISSSLTKPGPNAINGNGDIFIVANSKQIHRILHNGTRPGGYGAAQAIDLSAPSTALAEIKVVTLAGLSGLDSRDLLVLSNSSPARLFRYPLAQPCTNPNACTSAERRVINLALPGGRATSFGFLANGTLLVGADNGKIYKMSTAGAFLGDFLTGLPSGRLELAIGVQDGRERVFVASEAQKLVRRYDVVNGLPANPVLVSKDVDKAPCGITIASQVPPPPPVPQVSAGTVTVTEGNSGTVGALFTVSLSAPSSQTVTVQYATADVTTTAGVDYIPASGTLTFPMGMTSQTVTVQVKGDTTPEPNEVFELRLSNASNATIPVGQARGTINDDDSPVSISINDISVTEGNTGTVAATFTVTLSAVSTSTVTVDFATADASTTAGMDYVPASGTLSFPSGTTSLSVTVLVKGDTLSEGNEVLELPLSNPTNATVAIDHGHCTIVDDDPLPGGGATFYRSIGTRANYGTAGPEGAGTTVTATNGSTTVKSSGTAWKNANRGRGDRITIDAVSYTILSVDTDTELTLTSSFTGTTASGKSYTIARKFTTLAAWEDCIDGPGGAGCEGVSSSSLVTDNRREMGIAYKDSIFALTDRLEIVGSKTDGTHDITLTADHGNRHYGVAGAGVVIDLPSGTSAIKMEDAYVHIEWLEITDTAPLGSRGFHVSTVSSSPNKLTINNTLIHDLGDGEQPGIDFFTAPNADIYNNIIYNIDGAGIDLESGGTVRIFNNTIYNCTGYGIDSSDASPNVTLRNNIAHGNADGDYNVPGLNAASSHNLASDGSGTTHSPAGNGLNNQTLAQVKFVDAVLPGLNLHIQSGSTAEDSGADLSGTFTGDVDGGLRSGTWDRGADEVSANSAARGLDRVVETAWVTAEGDDARDRFDVLYPLEAPNRIGPAHAFPRRSRESAVPTESN